ncbi:protein still life, isoform SIF type 1 isoform X2 [Hyalella azteca]|uniref:Protein still life, isoform SIF type 1 isoform X2 n=1 Tax=Hyalella azteca TaxID=294128 RepID=A0A8B7P8W5_HYAAZ|nr:protein still life, isoform SIF type 1 isoform X2 [Hyalella azteca]
MHVSRSTKGTLSRLGVFTVSSFHAYICARSPSLLNNLLAGRGATKRRAPMLSRSNSVSSRRSLQLQQSMEPDKVYKVSLPDNQIANITLREAMTVEEFLVAASSGRGLNPLEHFVRVKKRRELEETNYFVPHRTDLIENYLATHEVVEICAKILYQVELSRSSLEHMWGFSVEAELIENSERQDELCCYISRVEDRSTAMQNGIIKSDEIMVINGAIVSDLDMMYIESVLQEELALCLMMRSSRTEPPDLASLMKTTDEIIESLVCPPPPSESSLNEEMISSMIVPAPSWSKQAIAGHMPGAVPGMGMAHMGINMSPGISLNNMGSIGGLNNAPMIGHGYNGMSNYGMGGMMMGIHQQQMTQSMMQYGKEPASPDGFPPPASDSSDRSNVSSLEIESFLKAGTGGNTSDLSGCSRSPIDTRREGHGGGPMGGHVERDMDRGGGMKTMLGHTDRASTGSNMERRSSAGGGSVGGGAVPMDRNSPTGSLASSHSQSQLTPSRQLSHAERLRKVLAELVETEASYVKHLNNLLENYLEPLRNASFLTSAEVTALFGNIREIVAFQRLFLQALREAIDIEPDFQKFDQPYEFKNVLVSIASAFLYYASQFKLYSSFCASHSKAQKVLHPSEGNQALQEFLASRNPRQQHSATLESYLIKPIQRILKYPLLLQQLKNLTDPGTDENRHLVEALMVMEKVAEHINEMQRIHEEYGAIFDHLFRQHQKACKQPVDLSLGDLLYYGGVEWLNISDFLGKIKKGLELHAMCFVFKTAVVFLCKERLRQKKKLMGGGSGKNNSAEVEIIRYQVLIPVTEVQVRASSMKDMDSHFLWELIHLKNQLQRRSEKVYHLSNSTSEFRNAFLKTIRQIIRESVRNMSIPNKGSAGDKDGGGSGASGGGSGGSRGGSIGSSSGGGSSSSRQMNTSTLQSNRSAGGRRKQQQMNQSTSLQRHSTGVMDYGSNLESYDNVPETQHNGHEPHHNGHEVQRNGHLPQQQQQHELNGAYRNWGKTGSDATGIVATPTLEYKTVTVYRGHPSLSASHRRTAPGSTPVIGAGVDKDYRHSTYTRADQCQNTLGIPPLYTHHSSSLLQGGTSAATQRSQVTTHSPSSSVTSRIQTIPSNNRHLLSGSSNISFRNGGDVPKAEGTNPPTPRNACNEPTLARSFSSDGHWENSPEAASNKRPKNTEIASKVIQPGFGYRIEPGIPRNSQRQHAGLTATRGNELHGGVSVTAPGRGERFPHPVNKYTYEQPLHRSINLPGVASQSESSASQEEGWSISKKSASLSTRNKSSGNASDSEVTDETPILRNKYLRNSYQNLSEFDDSYDYPDRCSRNIVPQQHPHIRLPVTAMPQTASLPQGIKKSVIVSGDVPGLLKAYEGTDRSLETKCNIRRTCAVEKIVSDWEFERILQSDRGETVPQIKNFKTSRERFIDRSESKHHAVSTLGTFTDFLSSLPAQSSVAPAGPSKSLNSPNFTSSWRSVPRNLGYSRPRCSSESFADNDDRNLPSSVTRISVRGGREMSNAVGGKPFTQSYSRSGHTVDPRRNSLASESHSVDTSTSFDTITIDSLLEQLKALK